MDQAEARISGRGGHRRLLLNIVRYALCLVALCWLVWVVDWHDSVVLKNAAHTKLRLIEQQGDQFIVAGRSEPVLRQQVDQVKYGIAHVVRQTRGGLALLAVLIFLPVPFLQSLRLVWMLAVQDVRLSLWNSIKLSWAGNFFNFALPGTVGGDLIKAYYITRYTAQKTEAVTTVVLDRAIGLLGLVLLAGVMIMIAWDPQRFGSLAGVLALVCAGLAVLAVIVFSRRIRRRLRLAQIAARLPMGDQLTRIGLATVAMRRHKALVGLSLANTIVLQFICMVSAWVMSLALGMGAGLDPLAWFVRCLIYVPIGFLIAAIPIAPPQAVGIMESAYIWFFAGPGGDSESQAVAFAVAIRLIQLVWAIPGVLVPLLGAHLPSKTELEALDAGANGASDAAGVAAEPAPLDRGTHPGTASVQALPGPSGSD